MTLKVWNLVIESNCKKKRKQKKTKNKDIFRSLNSVPRPVRQFENLGIFRYFCVTTTLVA